MRWLGLATKVGNKHSLTEFGETLLKVPERQRIKALRDQMLQDTVFAALENDPNYTANANERKRWGVNMTTYNRRKSTALAWLKTTNALLTQFDSA